jgi:hypothetical protein
MNEDLRNEDIEIDYIGIMREAMEQRYSRPRTGWHVTDVVLCPRQRVFKEIDPLPLTNKELNMYSSGRAVLEAVQYLLMGNPRRFEKEKYVEYNDIEGSIDIFDKKRNVPLEFKTLRSAKIDKPKTFQEEQLRYYMAMLNSSVGYLVYQCLMHFGNDPWRQFKVIMTEQQRKQQLDKLVTEIRSLQNAITAKDPSLARSVYLDKELKWLCEDCPYVKECEQMRAAGAAV